MERVDISELAQLLVLLGPPALYVIFLLASGAPLEAPARATFLDLD